MNNINKYIITIILVLAAMLFTGCAALDIEAEITEDHLVTYSYTITVTDLEDDEDNNKSIETLLFAINSHWNDLGFDSEITTEDETTTLSCVMQKQCDTREQAFETLHGFMTNDITLFDTVSYTYDEDYYRQAYSIQSQISLDGIVAEDVYEVYPAVVGENIDEVLKGIVCKAVFTLPNNQGEIADVIIAKTTTFDIPINEVVDINIDGKIAHNANAQYEKDLLNEKDSQQSKLLIYIIIGAVGLIAVIVQVIILIKSGKKAKKQKPDEDDDTPKDAQDDKTEE